MGWFGLDFSGGSSASSSTNTTVDNTAAFNISGDGTKPVNALNVANNSAAVTITQSDYGAIEQGVGLARLALTTGADTFHDSLAQFAAQSKAVVDKSLKVAADTQVSESSKFQDTLLKLALVIVAGVVVAGMLKRGG